MSPRWILEIFQKSQIFILSSNCIKSQIMQIIIKKDLLTNSEDVLNIFYGENDKYIENWINAYFEQEIEGLKMTPCEGHMKPDSLDFFVEIENNIYYLVKKYKVILKGYIYNSSEKISEKLFSIRCLSYDNIDPLLNNIQNQPFWNGINSEVTHRVMKQVDKDTLYQINMKFESAIKTKETWSSTELVMLQNEITKTHKKELYSSIVKKMKKFEKKQNKKGLSPQLQINTIPCKTVIVEGNKLKGVGGVMPDLSHHSGSSCALEYMIVSNKKEKFD